MTKRRAFLVVLLGILMSLCLAFGVACGGGEESETATLKWTINDKEHVTVTVDGKTDLPTTFTAGETIEFKVTPANGYEVTVSVGRTRLNERNGVYSYAVKAGTTEFNISVARKVTGVSVTTKPTKLVYYAGEELDPAGMVVEVNYATDEKEKVEVYTVNYQNGASAFSLGDTSFTVTYGSVTSAAVNLDQTVVGKVTLVTRGGTVSEAYENALKANAELANVTKETNGDVTFTFAKRLTKKIELPAAADITRGEAEGDFTLTGWTSGADHGVSSIPSDLEISMTYTANWNAHLVNVTSVKYENGTGADAAKVYLVVEGSFVAAKTVQLYFYEGNAKIGFEGDVFGGTDTKRDDAFTLKYDMNNLAEARWGENNENDYFGKWMDIKFVASVDEIVDMQDVNVGEVEVDLNQAVHNEDYVFSFQEYKASDDEEHGTLKAVANRYMPPITLSADDEDNFVLSGTLGKSYVGASVCVDYEVGSTKTNADPAVVADDGTYSVKFPLKDMPLKSKMYFHLVIKDASGKTIFAGSENNILNSWLNMDDSYVAGEQLGDLSGRRTRIANSTETRVLYVGEGVWNGVVGWVLNESVNTTGMSLRLDGTGDAAKGYVVVSGTWDPEKITDKDVAKASLLEEYTAPLFKNLPHLSVQNDWQQWDLSESSQTLTIDVKDDGTFEMLFRLPADVKDGLVLFMQRSTADGTNIYANEFTTYAESTIKVGKFSYTLGVAEGLTDSDKTWANGLAILSIEDPDAKAAAVEGDVALKVDNYANPTKVYYVVRLRVKNYTEAELKSIVYGNVDGTATLYTQDAAKFKEVGEVDGRKVYELWFDVTAREADGTMLWSNLYFKDAEQEGDYTSDNRLLEIKDADRSTNGLYAVVNGKKYTILCTNEANNAEGVTGDFTQNTSNSANLIVTTAASGDVNPEVTDPDYVPSEATIDYVNSKIEVVDGAPKLVIKGTAKGFSASDIVFDFQLNSGSWPYTIFKNAAVVDAQGNFTITVDLSDVPLNASGSLYMMHVELKPVFDGDSYKKDGNNVVHTANGKTIDLELDAAALALLQKQDGDALQTVNAGENSYSIMIWGQWERHIVTLQILKAGEPMITMNQKNIKLELVGDKVCAVIDVEATNCSDAYLSALHLGNIDGDTNVLSNYVKHETVSGKTRIYFDVTNLTASGLYLNLYAGTTAESKLLDVGGLALDTVLGTVTHGGKYYYFTYSQWGNALLNVTNAGDKQLAFVSAHLEADDTKNYYVLTAHALGYTEAELQQIVISDGNGATTLTLDHVDFADGVATFYFDLSKTTLSAQFFPHYTIGSANYQDVKCVIYDGTLETDEGTWTVTESWGMPTLNYKAKA